MVDHTVHVGPGLHLPLPVGDGGEGCEDEERPPHAALLHLPQEPDGLDGLTQSHLVGQNAALATRREEHNEWFALITIV